MTVKPTISLTDQARLAAIRADIRRRAEMASISTEEMDQDLAAWRAKRGDAGQTHLLLGPPTGRLCSP